MIGLEFSEMCKKIPILGKDFHFKKYQVYLGKLMVYLRVTIYPKMESPD